MAVLMLVQLRIQLLLQHGVMPLFQALEDVKDVMKLKEI